MKLAPPLLLVHEDPGGVQLPGEDDGFGLPEVELIQQHLDGQPILDGDHLDPVGGSDFASGAPFIASGDNRLVVTEFLDRLRLDDEIAAAKALAAISGVELETMDAQEPCRLAGRDAFPGKE